MDFIYSRFVLFFVVAGISSFSFASDKSIVEQSSPKENFALGLNVGDVIGNGLIVRFYGERDFYQVTYGGYVFEKDDEKYFNLSLSYARYLKKVNASALSSPVGLKWVTGGGAVYDSFRGETDNTVNIGTGVGIDFGSVGKTGLIYSLNAIYTLGFDGLSQPKFARLAFEPTVGLLYNFD